MPNQSDNTSGERRRSPRIEIFAQAEVRGEEIHIMEVRNISATGVFLEGPPNEYPDLVPGVELDLAVFANEEDADADNPDANVACHARIVRVDVGEPGQRPAGFGATIEPADEEHRQRLLRLLARAGGASG